MGAGGKERWLWGMALQSGKPSLLPWELAAMRRVWIKEAGDPVPFGHPGELCQGWGGKGLLWLLRSLDWQVGAEDRVGCGWTRGSKTCWSEGCVTCWLCLMMVRVQRAAWCCCLVSFSCISWLCHGQSWLRQGLRTDCMSATWGLFAPIRSASWLVLWMLQDEGAADRIPSGSQVLGWEL